MYGARETGRLLEEVVLVTIHTIEEQLMEVECLRGVSSLSQGGWGGPPELNMPKILKKGSRVAVSTDPGMIMEERVSEKSPANKTFSVCSY